MVSLLSLYVAKEGNPTVPVRTRAAYPMLAPFLILLIAFLLLPIAYSVYLSFFTQRLGADYFVGFANYVTAFHDSTFWGGLHTVLYFGIVQVSSMIIIALGLALILDSKIIRHKTLFRMLYFLPYAVPGVIATIMWGFLLSPSLDPLLRYFHGLNPLSSGTLIYSIVLIVLWEVVGYNMTLYYSALTSIPLEIYDAARLDGCGELGLAMRIKLPLVRPMIGLTLVLSIIGASQLFNEPFLLSSLTAIPLSYTPNMDIYSYAFQFGDIPYAATLSIILGGIVIISTVAFLVIQRVLANRANRRVLASAEVGETRVGLGAKVEVY